MACVGTRAKRLGPGLPEKATTFSVLSNSRSGEIAGRGSFRSGAAPINLPPDRPRDGTPCLGCKYEVNTILRQQGANKRCCIYNRGQAPHRRPQFGPVCPQETDSGGDSDSVSWHVSEGQAMSQLTLQTIGRSENADRANHNQALWDSVRGRDRAADGVFVYAVRSTGIYCRPSCPSRKPRREQVVFFAFPEAAEQQGFRACRRCRPRSIGIRDPRIDAVARVCREIESRISSDIDSDGETRLTLTALSAPAGMSSHQLERAFRNM